MSENGASLISHTAPDANSTLSNSSNLAARSLPRSDAGNSSTSLPNVASDFSSNENDSNSNAPKSDNSIVRIGASYERTFTELLSVLSKNPSILKSFSFPSEKEKETGLRSLLHFVTTSEKCSRDEIMFVQDVIIHGPEQAITRLMKPMVKGLRPLRALLEGIQSNETR